MSKETFPALHDTLQKDKIRANMPSIKGIVTGVFNVLTLRLERVYERRTRSRNSCTWCSTRNTSTTSLSANTSSSIILSHSV